MLSSGLKIVFSPRKILMELLTMGWLDYLILLVLLGTQVVVYFISGTFDLMSNLTLVLSLFTIVNLILVNRGRLTNYFWGTVGSAVWWLIALQSHLIGDIFSQSYYLIMQFVGIYFWKKNLDEFQGEKGEVAPRKISGAMALLALIAFAVIYALVLWTSHHLNGQQIFLDATLLPLAIVGQLLMTYGYRVQWLVWFLIDMINVIIWYNNWQAHGDSALGMFVLQILMLLNVFYGTYLWFHKEAE